MTPVPELPPGEFSATMRSALLYLSTFFPENSFRS